MEYLERIDDELLKRKLHSSAAVLIEGPKWCGKTSTGAQLAKSIIYIQNPEKHHACSTNGRRFRSCGMLYDLQQINGNR